MECKTSSVSPRTVKLGLLVVLLGQVCFSDLFFLLPDEAHRAACIW
jgi:hypothetical protein